MSRRRLPLAEALSPEALAKVARLKYVSDELAGYSRKRNGKGFVYFNIQGRPLKDPRKVKRIETLAIPPAWREVWICPVAKGHLQATGRDARKRKQYVYHPRWQEIANLAKFVRMEEFGRLLPTLRETVRRHLAARALSKTQVLAGMVALLDLTGIRVGNEEYVAENGSYGLTTLRNRHVKVGQKCVELSFRAKGGFRRDVVVDDKRLVRLIKECLAHKGAHAFQYVDEAGKIRAVTSADVNEYLQEATGQPFTAKDFRTWRGSAHAAARLFDKRDATTLGARKKIGRETVCEAAALLSNTPSVCRNYYIHPGLLSSYEAGEFAEYFARFSTRRGGGLKAEEQILMRFLERWKPTVNAAA